MLSVTTRTSSARSRRLRPRRRLRELPRQQCFYTFLQRDIFIKDGEPIEHAHSAQRLAADLAVVQSDRGRSAEHKPGVTSVAMYEIGALTNWHRVESTDERVAFV